MRSPVAPTAVPAYRLFSKAISPPLPGLAYSDAEYIVEAGRPPPFSVRHRKEPASLFGSSSGVTDVLNLRAEPGDPPVLDPVAAEEGPPIYHLDKGTDDLAPRLWEGGLELRRHQRGVVACGDSAHQAIHRNRRGHTVPRDARVMGWGQGRLHDARYADRDPFGVCLG